jgi:hypothetical protein
MLICRLFGAKAEPEAEALDRQSLEIVLCHVSILIILSVQHFAGIGVCTLVSTLYC